MAGSKSDYLENKVLDLLLGSVAYAIPATLYLALFTVALGDAGGGTEVAGGSYVRTAIANNLTNFPAAAAGVKRNGTVFAWPTASASWGTVVAVGIFDASTAGNLLFWATLPTAKLVDLGDTLSLPINTLTFTED